jgi:hypothetical protein
VDLQILLQGGVVPEADADYWRSNAVTGKTCDGAKVADLLLRLARALHPVREWQEALDLLKRQGVIWNDYWKDNALPGSTCNGEYVANLLRAAAGPIGDAILRHRYPVTAGFVASPTPTPFTGATSTTFNYSVGTQTFGVSYQFTNLPRLKETAQAIWDMGASVIKFEISPRYAQDHGNVPTARASIQNLTQLVRDEPTHRAVLDMPFADYVLWTHTFTGGGTEWLKGLTRTNQDREYREIYDLTAYLLKTYSETGKRFFLGHWEGDGWLRGSVAVENDVKVTPVAVQGMIDWLNIRQRAIDDAHRTTSHRMVQVWHYTEVNHVKLAMQGRKSVVSEVLPRTDVDYVSYSSYDTAYDPELLKVALTYIETKLPRKPQIQGKRVFIGEYGFPRAQNSATEQEARSRQVIRAALEWGCPFVLYWELYNNEVDRNGVQQGFWLIDDHGVKQPIYTTHARFLKQARDFVSTFSRDRHRLPTSNEFRKVALSFLAE